MIREIYIVDGGSYSGGGEAMFQLGCDLIERGYGVSVIDMRKENQKLPAKFEKYMKQGLRYCNPTDVVDASSSVIISPESGTGYLFRYKQARKMIYWLSYEFYDGKFFWNSANTFFGGLKESFWSNCRRLLHFLRNIVKYGHIRFPVRKAVNLSGSHFTSNMLKKHGISSVPLVHSIGVDFLNAGMYDSIAGRENIVLYNPAKPSRLTKKLVKRNEFTYIPIQSLSVNQMLELFRKSKVYIDFGNFPGPERLPKETVYNGVNVLVWTLHAAATDDVLIPSKYKLSTHVSVRVAEETIADMLDHYSEQNKDFDEFRTMVQGMEKRYYEQLDQICANYLQ